MPSTFVELVRLTGLVPSRYGEAMYARGRELIARGVDLAQLVWDADEVLWDWAMSGTGLVRQMPRALLGDLTHREYLAMRPGMLELLFGMHHAALESGRDPHVRIWTAGYPWRLWRILREVHGFDLLLGPPYALAAPDPEVLRTHPRVFTQPDYVAVVSGLIDPRTRVERLAGVAEPARTAIVRQLDDKLADSGFKVPELALLGGKHAFAHARVLIDDARNNVEWFTATGRSAVHVHSRTPRIALGRIRNSAWSPLRFLERSGHGAAASIADALLTIVGRGRDAPPTIAIARVSEPSEGPPNRIITIDVPNEVLWREWIAPMRELRKRLKRP